MHLRSDSVLTLTSVDKQNFTLTDIIGASVNIPLKNAAMTQRKLFLHLVNLHNSKKSHMISLGS